MVISFASWTDRVDPSDRAAVMSQKGSGRVCLFHTYLEDGPQHAIIWVCPAGHRKTNWYCAEHCTEMMTRIMANINTNPHYGSYCDQCSPPAKMHPLLESGPA